MRDVHFAYPLAFGLLALVPLMWLLWRRKSWRPVVRFPALDAVRVARPGWMTRVRGLIPALRTLALICLIVAVARPQRANQSSQTFVEGIAIQLAIDTSSSMLDTDLSPSRDQPASRLDVAKQLASEFLLGGGGLPGRSNDIVGVVRFARYADSLCPLTLDHENVANIIGSLRTVRWVDANGREHGSRDEDGTAIGDGLALAVERMKEVKRTTGSGQQLIITGRVIILLTDGENNAGVIPPEQAGELAATYGIRVYTILAGTGENMGFTRRPVDDTALRKIADVTGGKHFRARTTGALEGVYKEIDALERTRTEERRYVDWAELSPPFLAAAFAALALGAVLDATLLRKIP